MFLQKLISVWPQLLPNTSPEMKPVWTGPKCSLAIRRFVSYYNMMYLFTRQEQYSLSSAQMTITHVEIPHGLCACASL